CGARRYERRCRIGCLKRIAVFFCREKTGSTASFFVIDPLRDCFLATAFVGVFKPKAKGFVKGARSSGLPQEARSPPSHRSRATRRSARFFPSRFRGTRVALPDHIAREWVVRAPFLRLVLAPAGRRRATEGTSVESADAFSRGARRTRSIA